MSETPAEPFISPAKREPLLAPFEIPMHHPLNCDRYFPEGNVMGRLYVEAQFELSSLATFHRAAFETVRRIDDQLEEFVAVHKARLRPPNYNDEDLAAWAELQESRVHTFVHDTDGQIASIANYAEELCIIGLWAHTEKFLGKVLVGLNGTTGVHRWDQFLATFGRAGIDLTGLPGYDGAVECRLVNNALKHGGVVTAALAQRPGFAGRTGVELRHLTLDIQSYLIAVHHLVGALTELCGQQLEGGDALKPWRTDSFGRPLPKRDSDRSNPGTTAASADEPNL